jgi:hypothetical protein
MQSVKISSPHGSYYQIFDNVAVSRFHVIALQTFYPSFVTAIRGIFAAA